MIVIGRPFSDGASGMIEAEEQAFVEQFVTHSPVWNRALDGFGNKDPGRRRATQYRSPWDLLHPGRRFAEKLADSGLSMDFLAKRVGDYLDGRPMKRLPRVVEEQKATERDEAEDGADNA